jgi:hypothetical protein
VRGSARRLIELRPGLWRWTTRHPEWLPDGEPGSEDDWPPDVGLVAYAGPDAFVLIDPLVDDATRYDRSSTSQSSSSSRRTATRS